MSVLDIAAKVVSEFSAVCGASHVVEDPAELRKYQKFGVNAAIAVFPGSSAEVAAILRLANEYTLSLVPAGGCTQQQRGDLSAQADVLLLTSRLTEVEHYDAGDLTVGVGAGCTISQLSTMVADDGLLLALDPPLPERGTVGGAIATARHGPMRHGYGGIRDFCLGIRFVTGDGRRAKGGGRVVKNVAGYDLMKLLIGSHGTLAVVTSASFKLFPAPRQTRTFLAEFATVDETLAFRDFLLKSPLSPMCLELVSPGARDIMKPGSGLESWVICVRASGSDRVLARYRSELGRRVTHEMEGQNEVELWHAICHFGETVRARHPATMVIAISSRLSDVRPTILHVEKAAAANRLGLALIGRVGIGHLEVAMWPAGNEQQGSSSLVNAACALQKTLPGDASMTVLQAPEERRHQIPVWSLSPTNLESMRSVKTALDAKNVLRGGRFLS